MAANGDAKTEFADAVAIWRLQAGAAASEVIDAATQCLVEGLDSPTLRELAGASPKESWFVLYPMVERTAEELDMGELLETSPQRAALRVMVRRFDAGRLDGRELASWAHRHIGHEGDPECQPFVDLDDMYDIADYMGYTEELLGGWTAEEADAFLAGRPSPGRTNWHSSTVASQETRRLGIGDRLRRLLHRAT